MTVDFRWVNRAKYVSHLCGDTVQIVRNLAEVFDEAALQVTCTEERTDLCQIFEEVSAVDVESEILGDGPVTRKKHVAEVV